MHKDILNEGLRREDLKDQVKEFFTVDHFRSKMGEDRDVVVIAFTVKEKYPAIDLMEFMERGYNFILDADMSSGEESNGYYHVFVEIERTPNLPNQLSQLLSGVGQLCGCYEWKFNYQKTKTLIEFNEQNILENVPLTAAEYENRLLEFKNLDIKEFFDQGAVDVSLDSNNNLFFAKPYAGEISAKFEAIGNYDVVKDLLKGAISLDESSQSQVLFLTKYLGNYDINKIDNKFLIRNNDKAVIISKSHW